MCATLCRKRAEHIYEISCCLIRERVIYCLYLFTQKKIKIKILWLTKCHACIARGHPES
jgi:hypothetical protein